MNIDRLIRLGLCALLLVAPVEAQTVGPANGSLIVAGGALRDPAVFSRFVELAGGPSAPIVIIPTAGGAPDYDQYFGGRRAFEAAGAQDITILHTYDPAVADTDEFVEPLGAQAGRKGCPLGECILGSGSEEVGHEATLPAASTRPVRPT